MEGARKVEPKCQKNSSGFISPFPLLIVPFLGGEKKENVAAILLTPCYPDTLLPTDTSILSAVF